MDVMDELRMRKVAQDASKACGQQVLIIGGHQTAEANDEYLAAIERLKSNMEMFDRMQDPKQSLSYDDIGNFNFGSNKRMEVETLDEFRARRKAEKMMLKLRFTFGIVKPQKGTVVKRGGMKLTKADKKWQKKQDAKNRYSFCCYDSMAQAMEIANG